MFCHALIDGIEVSLSMWYAEHFQVTLFLTRTKGWEVDMKDM